MKGANRLVLVVFLLIVASCRSNGPITMPKPDSVREIVVVSMGGDPPAGPVHIREKSRIREILSHIEENGTSWRIPLDTFPTPRWRASFVGTENRILLVLWFGADWMGAKESDRVSGEARLRDIARDRLRRLKQMMGIDPIP